LQDNNLEEFEGIGDNSKIVIKEIESEDWRWMEPTHDNVQWQALVLAVLNFQNLLPRRDTIFYLWIGYQIPDPDWL
jgi:hypothetical protein